QHGKPADATAGDLATDPELLSELQASVDDANKAVSRAESIRKFRILGSDFTEASGHLTPSLKVKRSVGRKSYADVIEALYHRTAWHVDGHQGVPPGVSPSAPPPAAA